MLNFLDVYERALKGPMMTEQDFDMKVFIPELRRIVTEYGIQYDKQNPVPADEKATDNLFEAAVEFLNLVGVYCQDTNRVIHFSKKEIYDVIQEAPGECYVGEGKDAGVFGMRSLEDGKIPWLHVGSGIVATNEELMSNLIEGYGTIAAADSISISALDSIRGIPVMAGTPAELYAAIRGIKTGREALRRAGRPGLPIMNLISTAAAAVTTIAASAPQFGLRPTDGWLVGAISEMKIDFGAMNKTAYLLNWGANIGAETAPHSGWLLWRAGGDSCGQYSLYSDGHASSERELPAHLPGSLQPWLLHHPGRSLGGINKLSGSQPSHSHASDLAGIRSWRPEHEILFL
jgi:methylamine--corrinoid protein Co-methyltransferase